MNTIVEFRDRHDEIVGSIHDMRSMLQPEILKIKPNAKTAHKMLCSLGKKVKAHFSEGDRDLYPQLLTDSDDKCQAMAWNFISGETYLRKQFDTYYKRWLKDCSFNFSMDFMEQTHELLDLIEVHIDREQTVLLPYIERKGDLFEIETRA